MYKIWLVEQSIRISWYHVVNCEDQQIIIIGFRDLKDITQKT